jgi:hypothetical protein
MSLMLKLAIFIGSAGDTRHGFARPAPFVSRLRLQFGCGLTGVSCSNF